MMQQLCCEPMCMNSSRSCASYAGLCTSIGAGVALKQMAGRPLTNQSGFWIFGRILVLGWCWSGFRQSFGIRSSGSALTAAIWAGVTGGCFDDARRCAAMAHERFEGDKCALKANSVEHSGARRCRVDPAGASGCRSFPACARV